MFFLESLNNSAWKRPLEVSVLNSYSKARLKVRKPWSICCLGKFQKSTWKNNLGHLRQSGPGLLPWWIFFSLLDKWNSSCCSLWLLPPVLSLHSEICLLRLLKGMAVQLLLTATISSLLSLPLCKLDRSISPSWPCISMSKSHLHGWPKPIYYSRGQLNWVPSSRNNEFLGSAIDAVFNTDQYSAFIAIRKPCWHTFNLLSPSICVSFSSELFLVQSVPCLHCCMELFSSGCRTLYLKLFNFLKFPLSCFSSLPGSLWRAALSYSSLSPVLWDITCGFAEGAFSPIK